MCVRGHVLSFDVLRCIWMARRGSRGDTFPAVLLFGVSVDARMLLQAWTHISLRWTHCVCVSCCVSFGIVRGDETREGPTDRMVVLVSWVFGVNSCELNVALTTRGRRSLPHVHNKHRRFLSLSFTLYVSMPSAPQSSQRRRFDRAAPRTALISASPLRLSASLRDDGTVALGL